MWMQTLFSCQPSRPRQHDLAHGHFVNPGLRWSLLSSAKSWLELSLVLEDKKRPYDDSLYHFGV
jgi:hypothetical protein